MSIDEIEPDLLELFYKNKHLFDKNENISQFVIDYYHVYEYLKNIDILILSPMKTASSYLNKSLRLSDKYKYKTLRIHSLRELSISFNISTYLMYKILNKEIHLKYLRHPLLNKLNIFCIYYLNYLKKDNSKIKKIIISYRDPIERIFSMINMDKRSHRYRDNCSYLYSQIFYNSWIKETLIEDLKIQLNDPRLDIINMCDVEKYMLDNFGIVNKRMVNSSH